MIAATFRLRKHLSFSLIFSQAKAYGYRLGYFCTITIAGVVENESSWI